MAPPHERTLGAGLGFVWNKTRVLGILGLAAVLQMKDLNKSCYFFPAIKKRAFFEGNNVGEAGGVCFSSGGGSARGSILNYDGPRKA